MFITLNIILLNVFYLIFWFTRQAHAIAVLNQTAYCLVCVGM